MISSPLILNTIGDVHTSPLKCPQEDVNTSPPTFPAQGRRAYISTSFSCSKETSSTSPPAHGSHGGSGGRVAPRKKLEDERGEISSA